MAVILRETESTDSLTKRPSVTFINQLMHSIVTVVDIQILLYKSLKDTH
jgi:hypothetical protein